AELRVADGLPCRVQRRELLGVELPKSDEGLDAGEFAGANHRYLTLAALPAARRRRLAASFRPADQIERPNQQQLIEQIVLEPQYDRPAITSCRDNRSVERG